MAKACWNCGEYHENGASYCPFCGASFADGQKTFMEGVVGIFDFTKEINDPVYMQKKYLIPGVAILAAIIAIAAFVVLDNGEEDPVISADCGYNYLAYIDSPLPTNLEGEPYEYPPEGYKFAAVKFKFLVNTPSGFIYNGVHYDWNVRLTKDDTEIKAHEYTTSYAHWQPLTYFVYGEIGLQYFVFLIPEDADINDYEITASYVKGTVEYDPDINMDD